MTDAEIDLEMTYTTYGQSCRDAHVTPDGQLVECRRNYGHEQDHATPAGTRVIRWVSTPAHP